MQPEAKLSRRIMKAWRERGVRFVYKVHGSEFQPAGLPDIDGVYRGLSVKCETKMPGNVLSRIQEYRIAQIMNSGGHVVVAYSVEDALALIDHLDKETHESSPYCLPNKLAGFLIHS